MKQTFLMFAFLCMTATAAVAAECAAPKGSAAQVSVLLEEINRVRAARGLAAFGRSAALDRAASGHACAMVVRNRFSHKGAGGLRARVRRAGCNAGFVGETIAMGYSDARATLRQWMESPPHRRILLSDSARIVGIGVAAARRGQGGGPRWVVNVADGC